MGNDQVQNNSVKNELKGRGLFYGVIAVATFIVMAVGATFAYFTATTNSANTSVKTGSTTLKLQFISYETAWMSDKLIPAATEVVAYSFENQNDTTLNETYGKNGNLLCRDDYGNSICSVYVFQVKNTAASPQSVSLEVVSELNEFTNLTAMAFEVGIDDTTQDYTSTEDGNGLNDPKFKLTGQETDTTGLITILGGDGLPIDLENDSPSPVYINRKGVKKEMLKYTEDNVTKPAERATLSKVEDPSTNTKENLRDRTVKVANKFEIIGGETKTYALVLYIAETGDNQTDADSEKEFTGQVIISSGDGDGVSGVIRAVNGDDDDENPSVSQPDQTIDPEEPVSP